MSSQLTDACVRARRLARTCALGEFRHGFECVDGHVVAVAAAKTRVDGHIPCLVLFQTEQDERNPLSVRPRAALAGVPPGRDRRLLQADGNFVERGHENSERKRPRLHTTSALIAALGGKLVLPSRAVPLR